MSNSLMTISKRWFKLPFNNKSYKCGPDDLVKSNPEYFLEIKAESYKFDHHCFFVKLI